MRAAFVVGAGTLVVTLVSSVWLGVLWLRLPSVAQVPEHGPTGPTAYMKGAGCGDQLVADYRALETVSPLLACAVVISEDRRFFRHSGVDWTAVRLAAREAWALGRVRSGASTIPMQLARNLFLSPERSLSRKAEEMMLARRLVARLGRRRVLELYLNIAEWAPCRYGAAAAARHYFGRDAADLDLFEATLLAVILPRPGRPLVPDDAIEIARRQGVAIRKLASSGLISREEGRRVMRELDLTWRLLVRTGGAAGLAHELQRRSAARPAVTPGTGHGWLDARCGL